MSTSIGSWFVIARMSDRIGPGGQPLHEYWNPDNRTWVLDPCKDCRFDEAGMAHAELGHQRFSMAWVENDQQKPVGNDGKPV